MKEITVKYSEDKKEYMRQYRALNKERISKQKKEWNDTHGMREDRVLRRKEKAKVWKDSVKGTKRFKELKAASDKRYRESHKEQLSESKKAYRELNKDKIAKKKRQDYLSSITSYVVYIHTNNKGDVYVGSGTNLRPSQVSNSRGSKWIESFSNGFNTSVLAEFESKQEASQLETYIIKEIGLDNLVNTLIT
jgi:hypothetical protein